MIKPAATNPTSVANPFDALLAAPKAGEAKQNIGQKLFALIKAKNAVEMTP